MTTKISQREARRLKRRVAELERIENSRRDLWSSNYAGGTHMGSTTWDSANWICAKLFAARQLRHVIVAIPNSSMTKVDYYALSLVKK